MSLDDCNGSPTGSNTTSTLVLGGRPGMGMRMRGRMKMRLRMIWVRVRRGRMRVIERGRMRI